MILEQTKSIIKKFYKRQEIADFVINQIENIQNNEYRIEIGSNHINLIIKIKSQGQKQILKQNDVFEDTENTSQFKDNQSMKNNEFIIAIGKSFPVNPPKIYLKSQSQEFPSINDCRDYLKEIIKQWNHSISLKILIQSLKIFSQKLKSIKNPLKRQKLGQFVLGTRYQIDFLQSIGYTLYLAFDNTNDQLKYYVICVTDTHFLLFKSQLQPYIDLKNQKIKTPSLNSIEWIWLCFVSDIQAIKSLKIDNQNYMEVSFTFSSIKIQKMKIFNLQTTKTFKIQNSLFLINKILDKIGSFQQVTTKLQTNSNYKSKQNELLTKIQFFQTKLNNNNSLQNILTLQQAYQNAIDYYTQLNLPYYLIYAKKIRQMYLRSEIRQSLKSQDIQIEQQRHVKIQKQYVK